MPVFAGQQKKLTDQEKATVVKMIVPAVFDQVKQLSGIDFMALTNPGIEDIVNMPLFFPQTVNLRAGELNPISMTPDSMKLNLSSLDLAGMVVPPSLTPTIQGIVNDVKLTFKNYKDCSVTIGGRTINLKLPETIDVSAAAMTDDDGDPANLFSLNFVTGPKGVILPFTSLSIELELDAWTQLSGAIPDFPLKSGKFLTLTETKTATGTLIYNVTFEENLRSLMGQLGMMPNFRVELDMTKLMTADSLSATLYAIPVPNPHLQLLMGHATVYANQKSTTGIPADSIIVASYDITRGSELIGCKKLIPVLSIDEENLKLTTASSVRVNPTDEWTPLGSQIITMPASMSTTVGALMSSLVNGVMGNLKADVNSNFEITIDSVYTARPNVTIPVMKISVATELDTVDLDESNVVANIDFETRKDGALKHSMNIKAILPATSPLIKVEFNPGDTVPENPMATAYITSDVLGVITSNETISAADKLKVIVADGGLYIQNCEQGDYLIVGMNGRIVAQGIISGPGAFIATPTLKKGNIYIFSVVEKGVRKSIKFIK